ncbi:protein EFR3-like protein [Trichinella spiralis]|uniref:protein EFR3-like protein n=1 Tax=Trichinella spiralis TaxID=6334 RepID=UPI0001EFC8C9|nr:protein EFR3-like protein [Trichinella spiralis]
MTNFICASADFNRADGDSVFIFLISMIDDLIMIVSHVCCLPLALKHKGSIDTYRRRQLLAKPSVQQYRTIEAAAAAAADGQFLTFLSNSYGACELLFLWLLCNVPAAIQTPGRFDISVDRGKWSGQVEHAEIDLLRDIPPGEVGPHRRLFGPLLGTGYLPPAYRVCESGGRGDESAVVRLSRLAELEPLRGELFENGPPPVGDPAAGVGTAGHGKFCQLLQYRRGRAQLLQAALCHSNAADLKCRRQLRSAGIRVKFSCIPFHSIPLGLRGVVRKTASDDLQANIWDKQHMDKIVPSLLYNMHDVDMVDDPGKKAPDLLTNEGTSGGGNEPASQEDLEETPCYLADSCLRELMGKASFGNIKYVVQPTLNHFDYHEMWTPPSFAVSCFEALMYSVQAQYSYLVIQAVIGHLDKHSNDTAEVRTGIATVLSRIVVIAANASIGPSLLEIFNSMLRHLRQSVDFQSHHPTRRTAKSEEELVEPAPGDRERAYQDLLINTMGNFANNLPDYQKVEIMQSSAGDKRPLGRHLSAARAHADLVASGYQVQDWPSGDRADQHVLGTVAQIGPGRRQRRAFAGAADSAHAARPSRQFGNVAPVRRSGPVGCVEKGPVQRGKMHPRRCHVCPTLRQKPDFDAIQGGSDEAQHGPEFRRHLLHHGVVVSGSRLRDGRC